jgi:cytoskeletal protein RodZ
MQCPNCLIEFSDLHFYCPNCRTSVLDYEPEGKKGRRGRIERVGVRILNLLLGLFIIGGLVLMGRAVRWSELFTAISRNVDVSAETSSSPRAERASRTRTATPSRDEDSATPARTGVSVASKKSPGVESVREMPQQIEELPAVEDQPQGTKPAVSPSKTEGPSPGTSPQSTLDLRTETQTSGNNVQLGIEEIDSKTDVETGVVAINSYTTARIYINGQFSGLTPRTIKLSAGDHQIRLIADGYEDWTRRIRLKKQQQVGIMASMKKKGAQKD